MRTAIIVAVAVRMLAAVQFVAIQAHAAYIFLTEIQHLELRLQAYQHLYSDQFFSLFGQHYIPAIEGILIPLFFDSIHLPYQACHIAFLETSHHRSRQTVHHF